MKKSRFTETQIVGVFNELEAGMSVKELCLKHGISSPTYYQWKAKYGKLNVSQLKRLKEVESDLSKYKKMYAGRGHNTPHRPLWPFSICPLYRGKLPRGRTSDHSGSNLKGGTTPEGRSIPLIVVRSGVARQPDINRESRCRMMISCHRSRQHRRKATTSMP